jgi:hypothetical protein
MGGAVFDHGGTVVIVDSTLTGNSAIGGTAGSGAGAGSGLGGAVFDLNGSTTLTSSTVVGNVADDGGALYTVGYDSSKATDPASATLADSILSGSAGRDLTVDAPSTTSQGRANLDSSTATASEPNIVSAYAQLGTGALTGNPSSTPPHLDALAFNGGPGMETMLPPPGSAALAAGDPLAAPSTDERGAARPGSGATDLGAVQISGAPATAISITSPGAGSDYVKGKSVTAAYTCAAPTGVSLTSCAGPVSSGEPIDTSKLGSHTFTVNATDGDGRTATKTISYHVVAATLTA